MGRMALDAAEQGLVEALDSLREQSGWTVREQALALGLPLETLRAVLYAKNRAGPRVLYRLLSYVDQAQSRLGVNAPGVLTAIGMTVVVLWRAHLPRLLDRLWDRIREDFRTVDDLVGFLQIDPDEWARFSRGDDPSPTLLKTVVAAYSHEAQRALQEDPKDAQWCHETAELAELILKILNRAER